MSVKEFLMKEFDWLGYCISCNTGCCHNEDKTIPENDCIRQLTEGTSTEEMNINSYDRRPLECRLFPFDIKEINEKMFWIKWDQCNATPELNYENFMDFFERQFSRKLSIDYIKQYVENNKTIKPEKYSKDNFIIIREVNWPDK